MLLYNYIYILQWPGPHPVLLHLQQPAAGAAQLQAGWGLRGQDDRVLGIRLETDTRNSGSDACDKILYRVQNIANVE